MTSISYYISLNSPWTYMGAQRLRDFSARHDVPVTTIPVDFMDVFAATGGHPLPKRAPERQAYRMMELKRWRDILGLPLVLEPKHFPSDETLGARLVISARELGDDALAISHEIGRSLWERDLDIADAGVLADAVKRAGADHARLTANAEAHAGRLDAAWVADTKAAIERGVFGAPSYVLDDGEIFWGQDRVDILDWRLGQGS